MNHQWSRSRVRAAEQPLEVVPQYVSANAATLFSSCLLIETEMDPTEHAGIIDIVSDLAQPAVFEHNTRDHGIPQLDRVAAVAIRPL